MLSNLTAESVEVFTMLDKDAGKDLYKKNWVKKIKHNPPPRSQRHK